MLMDQSSRDDTLVDVGPPRPSPGDAVSHQSSRDKRGKRSPGKTSRGEGRAISADRARGVDLVGQHPVGPGPWPADRALDTQVREQRQHHRRVTGLAGGEQDGQRAAPSVDRGLDLRAQPAARAAEGVIAGSSRQQRGSLSFDTALVCSTSTVRSSRALRLAVAECWCARTIEESTDTFRSTRPTASASA